MADKTMIEWTDATWNIITGCSVLSPGCANCYAMKLAGTRLQHHPSRAGLTRAGGAGPVWNGEVRFNQQWLTQPVQWKKPRRIFVCAHGDLFHENVPDKWIDQVFAVMHMAPHHTFQVLTKRSKRMRDYFAARTSGDPWAGASDAIADALEMEEAPSVLEPRDMPMPNVWLGVSVEDQTRADERIPDLLASPAAVRFLSCEPLLGPIDLTKIAAPLDNPDGTWKFNCLDTGDYYVEDIGDGRWDSGDGPWREHVIDWVIAGGENGKRPTHPKWVRSLRDQCQDHEKPFFFKQYGDWAPVDRDIGAVGWERTRQAPDGRVYGRLAASHRPNDWLFGGREFEIQYPWPGRNTHDGKPEPNDSGSAMARVGKILAGATLDRATWREMPA